MGEPPLARGRADGRAGSITPWLAPTVRAVPWWPLAIAVTALASALAAAHVAAAAPAPPTLVGLGLALIVAAAILGLDDPARDLLAALPTSLARRRLQRLVLLVPSALGAGAALLLGGRHLGLVLESATAALASLAALAALGMLAGRLAERRRIDLLAPVGAGASIAWALASAALPAHGLVGATAHGWADRPWPWVVAAAAAVLLVHRSDPR
jgi:hypothetical protein